MKILAAALSLALIVSPVLAQPAVGTKADSLFEAIQVQDARLFAAYNNCDLKTLADTVSDQLEFYHDQTGLRRGRQAFIDATRTNICGKVHRELVRETLEVYPLKTYGAVEIGEHVFCPATAPSTCDPKTSGRAKFTMLWQQTEAGWKLTQVISYAHISRPPQK